MIERIKQTVPGRHATRFYAWLQDEMAPALLRRRIIGAAVVASLLATAYWLFIASDRYVSEARIIIQRTDLASGQSLDFSSLIGGVVGNNQADNLLLRDYLLSQDMLRKLDASLNLRAHYSDAQRDPLSRMWFADAPVEKFHDYYRSRVSIEMDSYAGVLVIKSQAYDPRTAQAISAALVEEGERFMNQMAHRLADEQVAFLEQQVAQMSARAARTRQALLAFQDQKGMVSPQATAETVSGIVARLQAQRAELETQRSALQTYLVPQHPDIVRLNQQISAVDGQLAQERARLASPGGQTLNKTVEEFRMLEMEATFAHDVYKTALVALERGRVEATRTIKKVSVLQAPALPEYALEPRRLYNALVFALTALLLAGIAHLVAAIVRDHKD